MSEGLAKLAGTALIWKAIQHAGVKAIFLARTLILARLLVPEDFGLLAISVIAVDFLLSVTDFGMIPALVQRTHANEEHYNAAWTVGIIRALGVTLVVVLGAPFISALFVEPRATPLIRVLAIRPLLEAAASTKVARLERGLSFRSLALIRLPGALVSTAVAIGLAPFLGVWALVIGALAGPLAYAVMSYVLAPYRPRFSFDGAATNSLVQFGRWIFLTGLIAVTGSSVLQVVVSRQLGATELGVYFLATKLAFLPAEVCSEVVGAVAFPVYARLQTDLVQMMRVFRTLLIGVSALIFPVYALMIVLAGSLVENVLGSSWEGTAPLIRLLALVNVVGLFGETVAPILKGFGHPYKLVVIELVQSFLLITLISSLTKYYGVVGAALAWLVAIGSSQIISVLFVKRILPRPFVGLGGPMLGIIAVSGLGALVASGADRVIPGFIGLFVSSLLALTVMYALLWVVDRWFGFGLRNDLGRAFPQMAAVVSASPTDS